MTGEREVKSDGYGSGMHLSGLEVTNRNGSAGLISPRSSSKTRKSSSGWRKKSGRKVSPMSCCLAWAGLVCAQKFLQKRSHRYQDSLNFTYLIRQIRHRSKPLKPKSIWPRPFSSFPASPAARSSQIFSRNTSSNAQRKPSAPVRLAADLLPSPIPDQSWRPKRKPIIFVIFFTVCLALVDVIGHFRISELFLRQ